MKLVDGTTKNEGRLLVYYDGEWGLVCENNFNEEDANVACRQLGFHDVGSQFMTGGTFGTDFLSNFVLDELRCTGSEEKLADCPNSGWRQHNCLVNSKAVELRCSAPPMN